MLSTAIDHEAALRYRRQMVRAVPVGLAVPIAFLLIAIGAGVDIAVIAVIAGAIGWGLAYLARGPVAYVLRARGDKDLTSPWFVAASGPAEELVRLGVVLLVGRDLDTAISIGLGWAGIEVVFVCVQGLAIATLMTKDDPEARRIRDALPAPPAALMAPDAPWWGVLERIWASVLHVAFTLIVAAQPALVLVTMPIHSAINLAVLRASARWELGLVQVMGFAITAVVAALAWWLWAA
jgi:hypothetical protein